MIDIHLLVYAGTLAIFITAALAVGILCVVVFTALATVASIKKARRNHQVHHEYADEEVHGEQLLADPEDWEEAAALVPDDSAMSGHGPTLTGNQAARVRRPRRPRIIQHT